jgi:serine phosphatase RsbU (regulator of sigma subunit)
MDIARDIQAGFLPDHLPVVTGWDLAAYFQPARRVGGDFYDAFALHDGQRIGVVVADVCDKGVGAALFMALVRSLVRAFAERMDFLGADAAGQARELVTHVNSYIGRTHGRTSMFATLLFAILDPADGALIYVNGGHEAPVISGKSGVRARLVPTGPAVGMLPDMVFQVARQTIEPGDTLLIYTDGITDARNAEAEPFSEERLLALLESGADLATTTVARVQTAVGTHAGSADQFDDMTMLAVHRAAAG